MFVLELNSGLVFKKFNDNYSALMTKYVSFISTLATLTKLCRVVSIVQHYIIS